MSIHDDKTEQLGPESTPRPRTDSSHGRFSPGDIVASRYRIVSRLGAGGMGEVYRADDTKLGQAVALKFLPANLAGDDSLLARLHSEVRIGRTVSHPNVCRLYDIAEADGQHFIAMEYVAGEDLSTLIRRIGRFPHDKGIAIATQLASGLAAAHAKGILHRDLKPANVMLDHDGDVRITDFGLASEANAHESGVLVGTPAYMAPEQLEGKPASIATDIYALGLVLFEIFTGKRAINGRNLFEIIEEHRSSKLSLPSSIVRDIDSAIEALILRCVDRDPARRPRSAREVLVALPGSDPLAAAIAAGETPSPELVAAAGQELPIKRSLSVSLFVAILVMLVYVLISGRQLEMLFMSEPKSAAYLRENARALRTELGLPKNVVFTERMFFDRGESATLNAADEKWWQNPKKRTSAYTYVLLADQSEPLVRDVQPTVDDRDFALPPTSGRDQISYDGLGRLRDFRQFPSKSKPVTAANWQSLFAAAALDLRAAQPTAPTLQPLSLSDARHAWIVMRNGERMRVDAGTLSGQLTWFHVSRDGIAERPSWSGKFFRGRQYRTIALALFIVALVIAILLARNNLRRGRADVRGTKRLSLALGAVSFAYFVLAADHATDPLVESVVVLKGISFATLSAALMSLFYLGLEPVIRRRWPQLLVSWTRLLAGEWRDPLVGRDILIGLSGAFGHLTFIMTSYRVILPEGEPLWGMMSPLPTTARTAISGLPYSALEGTYQGLLTCMAIVIPLLFTRRKKVAVISLAVIMIAFFLIAFHGSPYAITAALIVLAVALLAGPLGVATMQTVFLATLNRPFVPGTEWYATYGNVYVIFVLALIAYAFIIAARPRLAPLRLLDDAD